MALMPPAGGPRKPKREKVPVHLEVTEAPRTIETYVDDGEVVAMVEVRAPHADLTADIGPSRAVVREYGALVAVVSLPALVDPNGATAHAHGGVLLIEAPLAAQPLKGDA